MLKTVSAACAVFALSTGLAMAASHETAEKPSTNGETEGAMREIPDMTGRIKQAVRILEKSESCEAKGAILDLLPGLVYGGTRPLPTKITDAALQGADEEDRRIAELAQGVNKMIGETVLAVLPTLERLALDGGCPDAAALAADLKFTFEETEDVAMALTEFTSQCGLDDPLEGRCFQLRAQIDEEDGHLFGPDKPFEVQRLVRGYSVKLRSPFVPRWNRRWEEDVVSIGPLNPGQCAAVFKETKGLMLRLRLDGFTIIRDPWATPNLPRGTRIPIWTLEWVPSEYVKHFNLCNRDGTDVTNTVRQRIKQDDALNFFWRYYPKTRH